MNELAGAPQSHESRKKETQSIQQLLAAHGIEYHHLTRVRESSFEGEHLLKPNEAPAVSYTKMCYNHKPSVLQARLILFYLFLIVGAIQGYQSYITLELQTKGATYSDQSMFSFAAYPYIFKIIFAPFLDTYFIPKLGKSKTYLVIDGFILAFLHLVLASYIEDLILPTNVTLLTIIFFFLNCVTVVFQIAGEMWIVKIFDDDSEKGKGSVLLDLGGSAGMLLTYNFFVPLNNPKWISSHFYETDTPILTNSTLLIIVSFLIFIFSAIVLILIAEKVIPDDSRPKSITRIFKILPRFFTYKNMRRYLIFILITVAFRNFFKDPLSLKLIDNGISKNLLVDINTLCIPIGFVGSCLVISLMRKGNIMKGYFIFLLVIGFLGFFSLSIYLDLVSNHNISRTVVLLIIASIIDGFVYPTTFVLGFINTVTPEEVGNTFITFIMCWQNAAGIIPGTIGLKLTATSLNFPFMVALSFTIHTIAAILLYPTCLHFDTLGKEHFALHRPTDPSSELEN